eukprot:767137-Hanusia_phi.AAC.23
MVRREISDNQRENEQRRSSNTSNIGRIFILCGIEAFNRLALSDECPLKFSTHELALLRLIKQEAERADPDSMTVKELKNELKELGVACKACSEKSDFIEKYGEPTCSTEDSLIRKYRVKEARQSANNQLPFCAPKRSCSLHGHKVRLLAPCKGIEMGGFSFCEWNRPTTPRLEGSQKTKQKGGKGPRARDSPAQNKFNKRTETSDGLEMTTFLQSAERFDIRASSNQTNEVSKGCRKC